MDGSDDASVLRSLALRRMGTHMTSPGSFFRGQLETMLEMSGVLGPHGAGGSVARGPFHPATNAAAASLPYRPTLHTTAPIASPNLASAMGSPRGRHPIQQQQQQLQQQQSLHHYQEEQERQATAAESGDVAIVVDEDGASTRNAAEPRLISSSPHHSPAQEMTSLRSCNDLEAALPSGVPSALGVECHSPAEAAASAAASGCQSQQRPAMDCNSGRLQGDERTACGGQGCTRELACGGLREQQAGTPAQQGSLQQQQQQQQQHHHHHQLPQSPLLQGQVAGHGQLRQSHLLSHVLHQSTQQFPPLPSFQLQVQQQQHHQQQQQYQEQPTLLHRYHNHDDQNQQQQQQQQQQHHNQQQQPQHQQQPQEQQQQQQRYDLSVAARWLEQAIPFGLLVAVVFIREHLLECALSLWLMVVLVKSNDAVRKQAAMRGERRPSILLLLMLLLCAHIAAVHGLLLPPSLSNELLLPLVLHPLHRSPSFWHAMFIVFVNDMVVRFGAMVLKCALLIFFQCHCKGRANRRQAQVLTLVEYAVLLYRALIPTPVWYRFFLNDRLGHLFSSLLTGLYLTFKLTSVLDRVFTFVSAMRQVARRQVQFGTYSTPDEVMKAGEMCAICQEKMLAPITLRCRHIFCEDCVSEWFERERTCPLCRTVVKAAGLKSFADGSTSLTMQMF